MADRFRVKSPPVVAETLDGEATIVDLASGTYFALNESGTFVWDQLASGARPDAVAEALAARYEIEPDTAADAVRTLIDELTGNELIVADAGNGSGPAASNGAAPEQAPPLGPYAEPALTAFTDMQELLLLDPVHEVDEAGWPELK